MSEITEAGEEILARWAWSPGQSLLKTSTPRVLAAPDPPVLVHGSWRCQHESSLFFLTKPRQEPFLPGMLRDVDVEPDGARGRLEPQGRRLKSFISCQT